MIIQKIRSLVTGISWQRIYQFAQNFKVLYTTMVFITAIAGFAFLLLFPVLMLTGMWILSGYAVSGYSYEEIVSVVFWACTTCVAAINTIYLLRVKFQDTDGVPLDPAAGKLQALIDEVRHEMRIPRIDNIIVSEQISIDLVKTPVASIPFWSRNTLVIGLPLMQCLSPDYFKCAVIRKLLQYSKHRHSLTKWLHQLRTTWLLYMNVLTSNTTLSNILLAIFFRVYAPFYRDLATPIAHRNELEADLDSLQYINDEDLLQTIETVIVSKIYLDQQYFPKLIKSLSHDGELAAHPYSDLDQILKSGLTTKNTKRWLDSIYRDESHRIKAIPSLRARMHNMGRSRIRIPEKIDQTAAQIYLENDYPRIVENINQLWTQRNKHAMPSIISRIPLAPTATGTENTSQNFPTKAFL